LPRRSYLTARNDDVPFYTHVSRHCEERSNPENHSNHKNHTNHTSDKRFFLPQSNTKDFHKGTQRKNLANLENLTKILVQTKKISK